MELFSMNLRKTLAFFSYLFHPLFIPVASALYYFFCNETYYTKPEKYFAVFQIAIITILLPILFYFLLRASGQVDSIMISKLSQRKIPLLIVSFLTIFLIRKSITFEHFPELHFYFLGGLISTLLALIALFFKRKASLHMISISSLTLFVIGLSIHNQTMAIYPIVFLVFMNGVVASSRLEMKAHTYWELAIGFLFGVLPQMLLLAIWL